MERTNQKECGGFRDGWDWFLLEIIVYIIIIDRVFCNFYHWGGGGWGIQNKHVNMSEQTSHIYIYRNTKQNSALLVTYYIPLRTRCYFNLKLCISFNFMGLSAVTNIIHHYLQRLSLIFDICFYPNLYGYFVELSLNTVALNVCFSYKLFSQFR